MSEREQPKEKIIQFGVQMNHNPASAKCSSPTQMNQFQTC